MDDNKATQYRNFFLSFATAFFILSILFLFLMITVHPSTPKSLDATETLEPEPVYAPGREECLTVLFIGSQTGSSQAGSYILARFDPVGGRVPVVVLPPQALVDNDGIPEPLSSIYQYGGADYARRALAETLGISIDRYVRINVDSFITAAGVIGSVEFDLPYDLPLEKDGIQTVMSQGRQLLDGSKVVSIITNTGYEGGELTRCRIAGELTAAIINQRIDVVESTLVDQVFERIINLIDTDISYADYDNRKSAARFLAQLGDKPGYSLPVSGRFNEEEDRFQLHDTFMAELRQVFL